MTVHVDLQQQLAMALAENAALKAKAASGHRVTFKVSEKGAVSAYGLGRFPVTLYVGQWERLLGEAGALKAFLVANSASLSRKD